jgi:hypothetical protein
MMTNEVPKLIVVPEPSAPLRRMDRLALWVNRFCKRNDAPLPLPADSEVAREITILERRQDDRREHLAQIQRIIDRKQLEIDNLRRLGTFQDD